MGSCSASRPIWKQSCPLCPEMGISRKSKFKYIYLQISCQNDGLSHFFLVDWWQMDGLQLLVAYLSEQKPLRVRHLAAKDGKSTIKFKCLTEKPKCCQDFVNHIFCRYTKKFVVGQLQASRHCALYWRTRTYGKGKGETNSSGQLSHHLWSQLNASVAQALDGTRCFALSIASLFEQLSAQLVWKQGLRRTEPHPGHFGVKYAKVNELLVGYLSEKEMECQV